jgi:cyclophilin family peptidyl-prolyl cis-trans isomerase
MAWKIPCRLFLGVMLLCVGLPFLSCGGTTEEKTMQWNTPPKMSIDTSKKYTAVIETEKGDLVIELFAKDVPVTVNNFVFLSRQGYYDNTTFHRVIPDFMAQGGDPTGTGSGGPGYTFANEITAHRHVAGAISMANTGLPNSNGSQFFICYQAQPGLDGSYSVFGQLIEGMDVLLNITPRDPTQNPQFEGDKIIKITIIEE